MITSCLTYRAALLQNAPKIHTDLLWDLTWLFLILAFVYFGAIFYHRNKISQHSKKVALRKKSLSPIVSEFLFYEADATTDEKAKYIQLKVEIRQLIKDAFNRSVLSEVLLDLRKDVSGDTKKRLFDLYKDLGLHKDAYKKLKSWKWHVVSKGILELTQMRVEDSYSLITRFINDKRSAIRKQAEIATVTLKYQGINYFLDNTRFKISEWQQLKLLDVIRNFEDYQPPRFKVWLTSSNRDVVLFALRLIKYYNQNDAKPSLLELVKHKNNQIKSEAINCIKEFYVVEASETLKTIFWKSTVDIKILILDVLAMFGQENDLDFLNLIDKKESNFSVRSKAHSAINTIRPESILPTDGILDISGYQIPEDIVIKAKDIDRIDFEDALCPLPQIHTSEISNDESLEAAPIAQDDTIPHEEEAAASLEASDLELDKVKKLDGSPINEAANSEPLSDFSQLEVDFEVVSEVSPSKTNENVSLDDQKTDMQINRSLDAIDLSFLPFVVNLDSKLESISESIDDRYIPNKTIVENELQEIEVCFDEVQPNEIGTGRASLNIDEDMRTELPCNVDNLNKDDEGKHTSLADMEDEVERIEFVFEELDSLYDNKQGFVDGDIDKEILGTEKEIDESELTFLPFVIDDQEFYDEPELHPYKYTPGNSGSSKLQILECEIEYDEVLPLAKETAVAFTLQDRPSQVGLPMSLNEIDNDRVYGMEIIFEEVIEPSDKLDLLKEIPKIEFYSAETLEFMSLLDDIEELGDDREIPLLLEYLEETTNKDVRNRIREIVKKFSQWQPKPNGLTNPDIASDVALEYNVLEALFSGVDLEEQLILLDAVADIVDKSDLPFLIKIKDHQDLVLREKAVRIIKELEKRLANEADEPESYPTTTDTETNEDAADLFNVQFEITVSNKDGGDSNNKKKINGKQNTILEQLLTFPNKIIQSLNG